jgi:histidinol-phosphate aminotransferase
LPVAKAHLDGLHRVNLHERGRSGYLRLDMNEGVPGLPDDFVKAVWAECDAQFLATYPEYGTIQEKIASHNQVSPQNIILSNGSDAAIKYLFDAYVSPGDKILLTDPTFAMYPVYCRMFAAKPVVLSCQPDLTFSAEDFQRQISRGLRLAVVVNPNNPTGYAFPHQQLLELIQEAYRNDVLMVVDEAYSYFYPESVVAEIGHYDNLIVLRTFSKLCGLAAARLGYAVAAPAIIDNLRKVRPTYDVNGIAVALALKLLDTPRLIQKLIQDAAEGKDFLVRQLAEAGIEHQAGQANFVLIKCPGRASELANTLEQEKILVGFGFPNIHMQDYLRITVGSKKIMAEFWRIFSKIWDSYAS